MRISVALAGLLALGACETVSFDGAQAAFESLDLVTETRRAFAQAYQDQPFDGGTVHVLAQEHGELHTYSLTPCRGGTHICGGSGGVGHVRQTADFHIVTGAYPGRVFYLSPGGDGIIEWRGVRRELAWN